MFNVCLQANIKIQKSKFTFKKFNKQVINLIKLIKVYVTMISGVPEKKVVGTKGKTETQVCLSERIDDLQSAIQIKDIQLSELQNKVEIYSVDSKQSFLQDMRSIEIDDQERKGLFKLKLSFVQDKRSIGKYDQDQDEDALSTSLDRQKENGDQRVATCKATPRDGEIHVTGGTKVSEQTGNVTCLHNTQRKTLKVENTENISEQFIPSSPNNRLIDFPYASEVKQISTLIVNDSSINMTNNDENERDGLLPSPSGFRKKVFESCPTLKYIAPIVLDESGRPWLHGLL
ncbi:hypothetical protein AB205_0102890, partial [Aquarana catesbeiana]